MPTDNLWIRNTKTTVLIVGEGATDKAFLRHLKNIYVFREDDIVVKVEKGSGGSPACVIKKTIDLSNNKAYDRRLVIVDGDLKLILDSDLRRRIRENPQIKIIQIYPCIEGLFLEILEHPNFSRHRVLSSFCKSEFEKYIPADKQTEELAYSSLFPKEKLEFRRKRIKELDIILRTMQI